VVFCCLFGCGVGKELWVGGENFRSCGHSQGRSQELRETTATWQKRDGLGDILEAKQSELGNNCIWFFLVSVQ
jgi:hypothetical protein